MRLLAFVSFLVPAYSQDQVRVFECIRKAPGDPGRLRAAIERSVKALGAAVEFPGEGRPCDHTGALIRDLSELVDRRSLVPIRNHYFVYLRNDGNLLYLEQIELPSENAASRLVKQLNRRPAVIVTRSGSTRYEYVQRGAKILLLVAPYRGWTSGTRALADSIRTAYAATGTDAPAAR